MLIDHIDEIKHHNWISNLRDVPKTANSHNVSALRKHNTSGITGVSWDRQTSKWLVHITVNNKTKSIGYFSDKEDARAAREAAVNLHHIPRTTHETRTC